VSSFIIHVTTKHEWVGLAFERGNERLRCIGTGGGIPDIVVDAFDPKSDVFYRSPITLTPEELREEAIIHVPKVIREQVHRQIVSSQLGERILIQSVETERPAISPLAALDAVLEQTGSVNSAIVQADNGGLVFVKRSGESVLQERRAMQVFISPLSLKEFIELDSESRSIEFPDFIAEEIIISGSDLDHFRSFDFSPLIQSRRISIDDFSSFCDFADDTLKYVSEEPHRFTLAIGAAMIFDEILRESDVPVQVR
jgi:hypothetical protein